MGIDQWLSVAGVVAVVVIGVGGWFIAARKKGKRQSQIVGDGSSGIQSGRDTKIHSGRDTNTK